MSEVNNSLNSLINLYKTLDESKILLEDVIDSIGHNNANYVNSLPPDVQKLVDLALKLSTEQRSSLMRFIESIKTE